MSDRQCSTGSRVRDQQSHRLLFLRNNVVQPDSDLPRKRIEQQGRKILILCITRRVVHSTIHRAYHNGHAKPILRRRRFWGYETRLVDDVNLAFHQTRDRSCLKELVQHSKRGAKHCAAKRFWKNTCNSPDNPTRRTMFDLVDN